MALYKGKIPRIGIPATLGATVTGASVYWILCMTKLINFIFWSKIIADSRFKKLANKYNKNQSSPLIKSLNLNPNLIYSILMLEDSILNLVT